MKQNISNKIYYEKLDGLRAYACLGIVFMHVLANGDFGLSSFLFEKFIPFFSSFVSLFMILSSFSMCCGYYEKVVTGNFDLEKFYIRRYHRIFPFFALLCTIELIYHHDLNSLFDWFANLTLAFGFIPNNHIEIIGVGWFIGIVFIFYMLFPFFVFLIKNKKRAWLALFAAVSLNLLCIIHFHDAIGRSVFIYSFMYFVAGGLIYKYRDKLSDPTLFIPSVFLSLLVLYAYFYYLPFEYTLLVLFCLITVIGISSGGVGGLLFCFAQILSNALVQLA